MLMQVQKYITYMRDGGFKLASVLTKRFVSDGAIPSDLKLKFTSPKGMVIMDRDVASNRQRDFDLIRRQYSNLVDIS